MVDPKGQNILFRNQLSQKEQLIQMQNERLAEQTETIKDLRATVERMTEEIAGLRETVNEFQRMLFGKSSEQCRNRRCSTGRHGEGVDYGKESYKNNPESKSHP